MQRYKIYHPILLSFYSRSLYQDVARNWKGVAFLYLFLLLTVCWALTMSRIHQSLSEAVDNYAPGIIHQIPKITIHNGVVSAEGPQPHFVNDPETGKPLMIIDTTGQYTSLDNTGASILLTRTKLIAKRNARETRVIDLSEIKEFYVDQSRISGWAGKLRDWLAVVVYPFALIGSFIYRVIQVLIYAVIGILFTKITRADLEFQTLLRLATISITPVIILNTLQTLLGLSIPFFGSLCFLIAMGYLFYAVKVNKDGAESGENGLD